MNMESMPAMPTMPTMPMDIQAIQKCIPHRHPFLLIDRVIEAKANVNIVAIKHVSISDGLLAGHFPGNPVMPGVLIVEGIAQAAAVLGHLSHSNGLNQCYLTEVSEARFRRPVVPGDTMVFTARVVKRRPPFFWFAAECTVNGEVAAEVKLSAYIK